MLVMSSYLRAAVLVAVPWAVEGAWAQGGANAADEGAGAKLGCGLSLAAAGAERGVLGAAGLAANESRAAGSGSGIAGAALGSDALSLSLRTAVLQPVSNAGKGGEEVKPPGESSGRTPAYQLPAVTVEGAPASSLREEERVGTYGQPRWTTSRRFPSTRVYVVPEGAIEVEYWYRPTFQRDGTIETRMLYELEVGLPYRFQLDLYLRSDQDDAGSRLRWGEQFEVRWALADWGAIWGNPTLYFEYLKLDGRADKIEPKLLLGGEIPEWGEGWHWGVNFVAELEINGPEREHEYEFTSGLSRTIIDGVFSVGGEFKFSLIDVKGDRGHYETPFLLGPTFQWRPVPRMAVNLETLFGLGAESPYGQITLNVGFQF